jgi:FkbM family methyltransferase
MTIFLKFLGEVVGASRLLETGGFIRWICGFVLCFPRVLRLRSLGPVDDYLGPNFSIRAAGRTLSIHDASFGVVREIFGRECYVRGSELSGATRIVDLGGNCGIFTLFALLHAPQARIYVVEAQPAMVAALRGNLVRNGLIDRVEIETALVGDPHDEWSRAFQRDHPDVPKCDLDVLMSRVGVCDFLKCDIEGAEFHTITPQAQWLSRIRRISLEYHGDPASAVPLRNTLQLFGFTVARRDHGCLGYLDATRILPLP